MFFENIIKNEVHRWYIRVGGETSWVQTGNSFFFFLQSDRVTLATNFPVGVMFPYDDDRIPARAYRGEIIFQAKDGGSVLRRHLWKEILDIDTRVRTFATAQLENSPSVSFEANCAKFASDCVRDDFFVLEEDVIKEIEDGTTAITFPEFYHPRLPRPLDLTGVLGGRVNYRGVAKDNRTRSSSTINVLAVKIKYVLAFNPPAAQQGG